MCQLPKFEDPNLIVGFETSDDAAVYKINESTAIIQTVDIFPPVVDDPFSYGQIAAANSFSDVYAMGGTPKLAMNILCIPEDLDKEITAEILKGGYSKVKEAGGLICGVHSPGKGFKKHRSKNRRYFNSYKSTWNRHLKYSNQSRFADGLHGPGTY